MIIRNNSLFNHFHTKGHCITHNVIFECFYQEFSGINLYNLIKIYRNSRTR